MRSGVFDTLQISISVADQHCLEEIIPEATKRGMGVIAKRPVANAAWKHASAPEEYYVPYWERFKKLGYDFTKAGMDDAMSTALRFTLSVPGVSVAIVGTQKPGRWQENAKIVAEGPLDQKAYEAIRAQWKKVAKPDWVGQV